MKRALIAALLVLAGCSETYYGWEAEAALKLCAGQAGLVYFSTSDRSGIGERRRTRSLVSATCKSGVTLVQVVSKPQGEL